jgi:hypothetical protein
VIYLSSEYIFVQMFIFEIYEIYLELVLEVLSKNFQENVLYYQNNFYQCFEVMKENS